MGRDRASERLVWAVERMALRPTDRVLEIGCGHGVAVSLVCEKLEGGTILALDRSATMIAAATKRNTRHVAAGVASFQAAPLDEADLGDTPFDRALAVHVPVFSRGDPSRELAILERHLAPGGRLYLVDQPLVAADAEPAARSRAAMLAAHGWTVAEVVVEDLPSGRALCVVGTPGRRLETPAGRR